MSFRSLAPPHRRGTLTRLNLSVRMSPAMHEQVKDAAFARRQSMNGMLNVLLDEFFADCELPRQEPPQRVMERDVTSPKNGPKSKGTKMRQYTLCLWLTPEQHTLLDTTCQVRHQSRSGFLLSLIDCFLADCGIMHLPMDPRKAWRRTR